MGLYLIGGANFNLTVAKRKYYGSFNNIRSVVGRQVNKIMVLHAPLKLATSNLVYKLGLGSSFPKKTIFMTIIGRSPG